MTAGDRDQQQAATSNPEVDAYLAEIRRQHMMEVAAARAEEAARWQAKIEALIAFYDRHEYSSVSVDDLRAVLDES